MTKIANLILLGLGLACELTSGGCTAELRSPAYVETTYVPDDPDAYPHTVYEGEPVYYIEGRWYRRHGHRWAYYESEPSELYRYRRAAPPARHYREREYEGREGVRREAPPSRERPPEAIQVR